VSKRNSQNQSLTTSDYRALFRNGIIAPWYLRDSQLPFYELLKKKKRVVSNCHRRFGKGTTVLTYTFERAITEKIIIRYGAPTQKMAYEILAILIDHIYEKCPEEAPRKVNGIYTWASGTEMYVFGVKDKAEADKGRGTEADIIIADEYAFWAYKPAYMIESVLSPQLDETDGQLIIPSTPPLDLTHPYVQEVAIAEAEGHLFEWDMDKSIEIGDRTPEQHEKIIKRCKGKDTDTYKREYKCLLVADTSVLVVPEAQDESLWVGSQERPEFFDCYAGFDLGFVDFFSGVWGYLDFLNSRLVIEGEYFEHYKSTRELAAGCKEVESYLNYRKKITRYGDCSDAQQLYDMQNDHDYQIHPILKRSKMSNTGFRDSVINGLRVGIQQQRILVDKEKCPILHMTLKYGIWNERRTDFVRTEKMGHLDAMKALAYLFDNIDWTKNPYPLLDSNISDATHFISPELRPNNQSSLAKLVGK